MTALERPRFCHNEHIQYLDGLRDSGITNMFGAVPYLMNQFPGLGRERATEILCYWMKSFRERHKEGV